MVYVKMVNTVFSRFNAGPRKNAGCWRGSCGYISPNVYLWYNKLTV